MTQVAGSVACIPHRRNDGIRIVIPLFSEPDVCVEIFVGGTTPYRKRGRARVEPRPTPDVLVKIATKELLP